LVWWRHNSEAPILFHGSFLSKVFWILGIWMQQLKNTHGYI
jgi:hypothetical protein